MIFANKLGALGVLLMDAMEAALGELSPSAAALLLTLRYRGAMTTTALAGIAGVAQPTAVRVADGLARRGLVERQGRAGRTAPLRLTDAGMERADALQRARLRAMERLLAGLPDRERGGFERGLGMLLAGATRSRAFARTTCRLCDHAACIGPLCPIGTRASELERAQEQQEEPR
jgi:DNA-binding MarR family transcriptional regulator